MRTLRIAVLVVLVALLSTSASADYLIVSRSATIKVDADRDAEILTRVSKGDHLDLLHSNLTNRYYL